MFSDITSRAKIDDQLITLFVFINRTSGNFWNAKKRKLERWRFVNGYFTSCDYYREIVLFVRSTLIAVTSDGICKIKYCSYRPIRLSTGFSYIYLRRLYSLFTRDGTLEYFVGFRTTFILGGCRRNRTRFPPTWPNFVFVLEEFRHWPGTSLQWSLIVRNLIDL